MPLRKYFHANRKSEMPQNKQDKSRKNPSKSRRRPIYFRKTIGIRLQLPPQQITDHAQAQNDGQNHPRSPKRVQHFLLVVGQLFDLIDDSTFTHAAKLQTN